MIIVGWLTHLPFPCISHYCFSHFFLHIFMKPRQLPWKRVLITQETLTYCIIIIITILTAYIISLFNESLYFQISLSFLHIILILLSFRIVHKKWIFFLVIGRLELVILNRIDLYTDKQNNNKYNYLLKRLGLI